MRLVVLLLLLAIIASLGVALAQLLREGGKPGRLLEALTLRVALSVLLFLLLLAAWYMGLIEPHGLV